MYYIYTSLFLFFHVLVILDLKNELAAKEDEHFRVSEHMKKMSRVRDLEISRLESDAQLIQERC